MKYLAINGPRIRWRIKKGSPSQRKLKSVEGFYILNPLIFSKEYEAHKIILNGINKTKKGDCFILTDGIILKTFLKDEGGYGYLFKKLNSFFRYLRFVSMQVEIPSYNSAGPILYYIKRTPKTDDVKVRNVKISMSFNTYYTSVTWENIIEADLKMFKDWKIPVSESIFLDAYKASNESEYDKTILFSVISIESLLANIYEKLYKKEITKNSKRKDLRIIKNDKGIYYDPIFKSLLNKNDFKRLLHEIPLYLQNRSILLENDNLYQDLIKLHNTRNKIVHLGAPIETKNNGMVEINEIGAQTALYSAIDIFNWCDIKRYNALKTEDFITL